MNKMYFWTTFQINANTEEIYNRLKNNSIINNKKKPICKNSLLQTEP